MTQVASPQVHVRFHPDCFLIPENSPRSARPHFEARTLSLPLAWHRKVNEADLKDPTFTPSTPPKLVVKVPSFTRKAKLQSPERDSPVKGCLHSPTSPPRAIPIALPSWDGHVISPISVSPTRSTLPLASPTVPLRPCCQACYNKMLIASANDYVPRWSAGARRKKERDDKEAIAYSPTTANSTIDALMLDDGYRPFVFGLARVDEVEVRRGKGAPPKIDEEPEREEEASEDSGDTSDLPCSPPVEDLPNPFERLKQQSPMSPSAQDRAYADMIPPLLSPSAQRPPLMVSPPSSTSGQPRRQSFTERSSSVLHACLRGGSAMLKGVATGETAVNVKLL